MYNMRSRLERGIKGDVVELQEQTLLDKTEEYPDDETKLLCFNLGCTVEGLSKYPPFDTSHSWQEYLYSVEYTFTYLGDEPEDAPESIIESISEHTRTVHYIVRGNTELDRDAFLQYIIDTDLDDFEKYTEYSVDYDVKCLGLLVF